MSFLIWFACMAFIAMAITAWWRRAFGAVAIAGCAAVLTFVSTLFHGLALLTIFIGTIALIVLFFKVLFNAPVDQLKHRNRTAKIGSAVVMLAVVLFGALLSHSASTSPSQATVDLPTAINQSGQQEVKNTAVIGTLDGTDSPEVSTVKYHAYDAPVVDGKNVNNFGANQDPATVQEAVEGLKLTASEDPLEFSAIVETRANGINAANDNGETARSWLADHDKWQSAINSYFDGASFILVDADLDYFSLGAIRDASGNRSIMPKLTQLTQLQHMGKTLIVMKNGKAVQMLRVPCDYQPASPVPYQQVSTPSGGTPEIPATPTTPSTPVTSTTPHTSTTESTPSTTTTTTPSTSTTTTPSTTTTTTPSTSTTTTTTTTPTTTEETCLPGQFHSPTEGCLDQKNSTAPSFSSGITPMPSPSASPESSAPIESNPATPGPTTETQAGLPAGGASEVPTAPSDTASLPPTADNAPATTNRQGGSNDPDGNTAGSGNSGATQTQSGAGQTTAGSGVTPQSAPSGAAETSVANTAYVTSTSSQENVDRVSREATYGILVVAAALAVAFCIRAFGGRRRKS